MRASPGSVRPAAGCGPSERAIRREDATNVRLDRLGPDPGPFAVGVAVAVGVGMGAPARWAAPSTAPTSKGRVARPAARVRTSSVRSEKLANERARGPFSVCTDSRISKRPFGRVTTYAIPTRLPLHVPTTYGGSRGAVVVVRARSAPDPARRRSPWWRSTC
jgi:hypothetical protein